MYRNYGLKSNPPSSSGGDIGDSVRGQEAEPEPGVTRESLVETEAIAGVGTRTRSEAVL